MLTCVPQFPAEEVRASLFICLLNPCPILFQLHPPDSYDRSFLPLGGLVRHWHIWFRIHSCVDHPICMGEDANWATSLASMKLNSRLIADWSRLLSDCAARMRQSRLTLFFLFVLKNNHVNLLKTLLNMIKLRWHNYVLSQTPQSSHLSTLSLTLSCCYCCCLLGLWHLNWSHFNCN